MTEHPVDHDTGEIQVKPFAAFLQEQSGGRTHNEEAQTGVDALRGIPA